MLQASKTWTPPPSLTISSWADRYRQLSPEASSEAGQWRTSRAPYQKEMMDVFNDPNIQRIVVMTSSQVGKTEIILNTIAYFIDQDPSPMLILQPTLQMAQAFSKDRLAPMIRDTEKIRNCVKEARSRDSGNTVLHKKFAGGHLTMVGSNSAAGLASRPCRLILADEVDRYEASAGSEGDPINLAIARTKTFWNRKIYMCSTPTIKGLSRIEAAFEESDKRYYYVPCPECDHKQTLKWKNVVWEDGKPETAAYACEECGSIIEESKKQWMLKHGEWRATSKTTDTAGFHISELYSTWSTWAEMAKSFLEAKKQPEMLKTWVNTALGEVFESDGDSVEAEPLLERRKNFDIDSIPSDVLVLTGGVDVQANRIELQVCGWGHNYECWVIDYRVFHGDPSLHKIWNDLDEFLKIKFETEDGRKLGFAACCIDSGHHTETVYAFCKPRSSRKIYAVKGQSQAGKPIANRGSYVGKSKNLLFPVGTDTAKEAIFARLTADIEKTTLHFSHVLDEEYFLQLTAEKRVTKFNRGKKTLVWKQIRERNEALDTLVYNFAAAYILQPNFKVIEQKLARNLEIEPEIQENGEKITRKRPVTKHLRKNSFVNSWKY